MKIVTTLVAVSGLMGIVAVAPALAADKDCLMKGSVQGWTVPDNQHLVVNSNVSDKYNVTLLSRCTGLQFAETLAFETRGPSLCIAPGDSISFRQGGSLRETCSITDIQRVPKTSTNEAH